MLRPMPRKTIKREKDIRPRNLFYIYFITNNEKCVACKRDEMDVYDSMMGNIIDLNTTQDIPFFQHLSSIFCTHCSWQRVSQAMTRLPPFPTIWALALVFKQCLNLPGRQNMRPPNGPRRRMGLVSSVEYLQRFTRVMYEIPQRGWLQKAG